MAKSPRQGKVVKTPDEEFAEDNSADDSFLLPNEGEAMHDEMEEPSEEEKEVTEDQAMFAGNHPLVDAIFEWMDAEIAATDSITAAHAIAKEYKITVNEALVALNVCKKVFELKRVSFQNIYDSINK